MYFSPTASTTYGAAVCDSSASTCANSWKPTSVANFFNPSPLGTSSSQQPALPILGSSNVWVSNFNFITQYYTTGFTDNSGNALQAGGSTMNEYFGLKFNGLIQIPSGVLPAGTTNAQYQFALVSDDGATLSINNQMIVNGDGTHASKMSCFSTPTGTTPTLVTLSTTTAVPFELQYYEGPRCEIALMMLYRKVPTAGNIADTLCALPQSNTLLFTPPQNSTCTSGSTIPWTPNTNSPTTANNNYTTLVADGWAPVPPTWFVLPPNTTNTCAAAP